MTKVSILMPVYNSEKYLEESIISLLNQTYKDFKLIIINDGSNDRSEEIIKKFNDSRIYYIKNEKNRGLIYTLNKGINLCETEYIARMDSDDICHPKRIEKQINYLEKNNDVNICGSYFVKLEKNKQQQIVMPETYEEIKAYLLFASPFCHPTVMFRKKIFFDKKYDEKYKGIEDYKLWIDLVLENKSKNLKENLLKYRIVDTGITQTEEKNYEERVKKHKVLYKEIFFKAGFKISEEELELHSIIQNNTAIIKNYSDETIKKYINFSKKLLNQNKKLKYCHSQNLKELLGKNLVKIYVLNRKKIGIKRIIKNASILPLFGMIYFLKKYIKEKDLFEKYNNMCKLWRNWI